MVLCSLFFFSRELMADSTGFHAGYYGEFRAKPSLVLWNLVTLGYGVGAGFQVEAQAQGDLRFSDGAGWTTGNPRFGFSSVIYADESWFMWGNANVELPLTKASRDYGQGMAPGSYQMIEYWLKQSPFGFAVYNWVRFYPYSSDLPWEDVLGNVRPHVSFRLGQSLVAQAMLSIDYAHYKGLGWRELRSEDVSFEPGVNWNVLPGVTLRPYLSFPAMSAGMWITGLI
jgi:hypothetical protein